MATNAVYKRFNGTEWVEYHFATNAGQVSTTAGRKFLTSSVTVNSVAFTLGNNDSASVTIGGANIVGNASVSSGSLTYISASDSVASALGKLDQAAKEAYDNIPSGILTTSNYASTLDSVYAPYSHNHDSSYVPLSRTVNGKALSSNITLGSTDIGYSNNSLPLALDVKDALDQIVTEMRGIQKGYGITVSGSFASDELNASLNSSNNDVTLTATFTFAQGGGYSANKNLKLLGGESLNLGNLKIGDNVFITDLEIPDRWVSAITIPESGGTGTITLSKLETTKVDLTNYQTKQTTLAGYGITDAYISNGTIVLGSNSITPLTQHQSLSGYATEQWVQSQGYLTQHQSLSGYATEQWVDSNFSRVSVGSSAPSNPSTGDIWIATA